MPDVNPNGYPVVPKVIEGLTNEWSQAYFIPPHDYVDTDDTGHILNADGSPREMVYVQLLQGEVFLTTGSAAPESEYQGIHLQEDDPLLELYAGTVVRFRVAGNSAIKPTVVVERQLSL